MFQRISLNLCLVYVFLTLPADFLSAQPSKRYWQQEVKYKMDINLDVRTNRMTGSQTLVYTNHSPDVLDRVYFHLFLNAFQPGSVMDIRNRTLPDADPRVGARISELLPEEIGYQKVITLTQNGQPVTYEEAGTILEVRLHTPVRPGQTTRLSMEYEAQVPVQIRRNGRDNSEGIRYSMAQAYPKLCEYDAQGWHATPYVGREFYGVWGDFDVAITLDSSYTVAATGVLKNAKKIGHGYARKPAKAGPMLTWKFEARDVHDFVWAADPDYIHDVHTCSTGLELHAFYQPHETFGSNWEALLPIMEEAFSYINTHFGPYPYPVYSFIQGGDGGMEYPMATLITGNRTLTSLVGVSVHELMHSWYQMILGFNESLYYWMDEGFTQYASERVMEHLKAKKLIPGEADPFPYEGFYKGYANLVRKGIEEPLSTHADHFEYNSAYSIAAYVKGAIFLHQLEYVIGKPAFDRGMLTFFDAWKFKHPDANDFIRIMEKESGLELDWYKEYMVYSTKTVDYAIDTLLPTATGTSVLLERRSAMPMPIDVQVTLRSGDIHNYTIPLDIMRGAKHERPLEGSSYNVMPDWDWVNGMYNLELPFDMDKIERIQIDPSRRLADLEESNQVWPVSKS